MVWPVDPSAINTALLLAVAGYLWRQTQKVDQVRQVLLGMDGHGGALAEIKLLRERSHDLANALASLQGAVMSLTEELMDQRSRKPGEERRHGR